MFKIPTVLFVCSANLYRSRVAEAFFNHQAQSQALGWCAYSRGLSTDITEMKGLAPHAQAALEARHIDLEHTANDKTPLTAEDLEMAHIIIALSEEEHQPMVAKQFPDWLEQFNFWKVEDTHLMTPDDAVARIKDEVDELMSDLVAASDDQDPPQPPQIQLIE